MKDPRVSKLAELLVSHSIDLQAGDRVLIHAFDTPEDSVSQFVEACQSRGAQVIVRLESNRIKRQMMRHMSEENARLIARAELAEMKEVNAYLALRGTENSAEMKGIDPETLSMWQREYTVPVVFETRVPNTKWVVLRWPLPSMAQQAEMCSDDFEEFFFKVCTMDYSKMAKAAEPLKELMDRTDRVEIKGPGTDLTFSIKDIGSIPCVGHRNIPDGECFSCPVKESVEGVIQFNTVSLYQGIEFKNIRYEVKKGKIVDATAGDQTSALNNILDTDEGARYFGEWALGFNPYILHPMKDTLFDEKIAGSFHLTPGNAYPPPGGNGNKSAVHWDTVMIQRPEYGGGEIWFDGVLVRKDGLFVLPELEGLNPDRLA